MGVFPFLKRAIPVAVLIWTGCSPLQPTQWEEPSDTTAIDSTLFCSERELSPEAARYYGEVSGLKGEKLRTELRKLLTSSHRPESYKSLWTLFLQSDPAPNGKVWDLYSNTSLSGDEAPYWFTFEVDQDPAGGGCAEGEFYNREHSWPKSGWGGSQTHPAYTDAHHIFPVDCAVNLRRSNFPYGETDAPTWVSRSGSRLGPGNTKSGGAKTVFEPIDIYKGDLARAQLYTALRYGGDSLFVEMEWNESGARLKGWFRELMGSWGELDGVSDKERSRNEAIFRFQGNRNPYIDCPRLVRLLDDL